MIFYFDDCLLDLERRELRRANVLCSVAVFDVLAYLIRHRNIGVRLKQEMVNFHASSDRRRRKSTETA